MEERVREREKEKERAGGRVRWRREIEGERGEREGGCGRQRRGRERMKERAGGRVDRGGKSR